MTSIISMVRPDAFYLATDGVAFTSDGTVTGYAPKAFMVPHLQAAFSFSGGAWLGYTLVDQVAHPFATFDELVDGLADYLPAAHKMVIEEAKASPYKADYEFFNDFTLIFGGWSADRAQFEAYIVNSMPDRSCEAYRPRSLGPLGVVPIDVDCAAALGLPDSFAEFATMDPRSAAIRIMDAQRHILGYQREDSPPFASVGMFCQLTKVTTARIETEIVWRWPDSIGEKIDPVAAQGAAP